MRGVGHVAYMEVRNIYKILVRKHKEKSHLEVLDIGGKKILGWILGK
jgi:hypothetical protein